MSFAIVVLMAGLIVSLLPEAVAEAWTRESGPFEVASVVFYAGALTLVLSQLAGRRSLLLLSAATMLLWACLRELDFQRRFTYRSVESIGYFSRPQASWAEKLLVILIFVPFVLAGLCLLREIIRRTPEAWREGRPWLGYLAWGLVLGVVASVSEKLFGLKPAEEVIESGLALLVLSLVWQTREFRT